MEETSAYVRAMRQLDYRVMDQLTEERQESRGEESLYTQITRVKRNHHVNEYPI